MDDILYSDAARVLVVSATCYSVRADWWTSNYAMYEYGINGQVQLTMIRSYPFRPNFYESPREKQQMLADLVRITITLTVAVAMFIIKVKNYLFK